MKVVMKILLQTDGQMRKYKQTKRPKKGKLPLKMQMRQKEDVFLRETEQFLALVNLPSNDSLPFVTFVLPQKTKKKKDETPDPRLIYIFGHTTAKNSIQFNCFPLKMSYRKFTGCKIFMFCFSMKPWFIHYKNNTNSPTFGLMTSVCKGN